MVVPSLLLWTKVLDESRERTLWERIRRAVSFVVTVIVALALAFALARPSTHTARHGGRRRAANRPRAHRPRLVMVDAGAHTHRRNTMGTRGRRSAQGCRRRRAASEIAVATTADGMIDGPSADSGAVDAALDRVEPGGGAGTGWPRLSGAEVHFLTDGAIARALEPAVVVHSVYEAAPNAGITAFDVRPALDGTASARRISKSRTSDRRNRCTSP